MKIVLFRALPDSYRQSMDVYASSLEGALKPLLSSTEKIVSFSPAKGWLKPRLLRYWYQYVLYPGQARRTQADVNHITDHAFGHLLHHLDPRKAVVTVHDLNLWTRRFAFIHRHILSGIRLAAQVICVSEFTQRAFLRFSGYPSERTTVIHQGVAEPFLNSRHEDIKGDPGVPQGRYLLHVGHTQVYKNIPALFHVLSILVHSMKLDVRLLKVGEYFTCAQERLAQTLGISDRIVHLGLVPRNRLPDIYRRAELLLFPSLEEGFGLPVLEAMASGIPVVASNRGALPEVVGQTGILVDPLDYRALAQAVASILNQPHLQKYLSEEGRKRARSFSWDRTALKTLELYRRIGSPC